MNRICKVVLAGLNTQAECANSLGLGYLKTYADSRLKGRADISVVEYGAADGKFDGPGVAEDLVSRQPDIVGFSCFLWNVEEAVRVSKLLKKKLPEVKIIMGGPEASGRGAEMLDECRPDAVVLGEGECVFEDLVRRFLDGQRWAGAAGTCVKNKKAVFYGAVRPMIEDLNVIPSPYLSGVFDFAPRLSIGAGFANNMPHRVVFETSRGCPRDCSFCAWTQKKSRVRYFSLERVRAEAEWIVKNAPNARVFVSDADIFMNRIRAIKILRMLRRISAGSCVHWGFETDIRLWDREIARAADCDRFFISVGVQSTNKAALKEAGRPCDTTAIERSLKMCKTFAPRAHFSVQLMCGMPGDDFSGFRKSLEWGINRPACDIYRLEVLPGTRLARRAGFWNLRSEPKPPYQVKSFRGFSSKNIDKAMSLAGEVQRLIAMPVVSAAFRRISPDSAIRLRDVERFIRFSRKQRARGTKTGLNPQVLTSGGSDAILPKEKQEIIDFLSEFVRHNLDSSVKTPKSLICSGGPPCLSAPLSSPPSRGRGRGRGGPRREGMPGEILLSADIAESKRRVLLQRMMSNRLFDSFLFQVCGLSRDPSKRMLLVCMEDSGEGRNYFSGSGKILFARDRLTSRGPQYREGLPVAAGFEIGDSGMEAEALSALKNFEDSFDSVLISDVLGRFERRALVPWLSAIRKKSKDTCRFVSIDCVRIPGQSGAGIFNEIDFSRSGWKWPAPPRIIRGGETDFVVTTAVPV